jgi:hypothetical protein
MRSHISAKVFFSSGVIAVVDLLPCRRERRDPFLKVHPAHGWLPTIYAGEE